MAVRKITFEEIGVEGLRQSRLPTDSDPSPPSKIPYSVRHPTDKCKECGKEIASVKWGLILCDECKKIRNKLMRLRLPKQKKKKVVIHKQSPPIRVICQSCGKLLKDRKKNCRKAICEECKKERNRKHQREKWKILKEENSERYKELCHKPGGRRKEFSEDEIERKRKRERQKYKDSPIIKKQMVNRNRKRRLRKNGLRKDYTKDEWEAVLNATKGICPQCKKQTTKDNPMCLDHVLPISKAPKGTIYTINDIQPLCRICNSIKGNKTGE